MRHALSMAMQNYEGAIILVSHDRSLINSVTDKLILIRDGKVELFDDDMDAYLRILKKANSDKSPRTRSDSDESQDSDTRNKSGLSKKEKRQRTAQMREQLKPRRDAVRNLDKDMQKLQVKISELEVVLNQPEIYEIESTASLGAMMQKKSDLEKQLANTETRWYEAAEKLEELEQQIARGV